MSGVEGLAENIARYWKTASTECNGPASIAADLTADYVVIPKADLPELRNYGSGNMYDGNVFIGNIGYPLAQARRILRSHAAFVAHLESRESARVVEEAKLTKRRDEVVAEIGKATYGSEALATPWSGLSYSMQTAVDLIIAERDGSQA